MTTYNLNPNMAKEADQVSNRITETGAYTGKFTVAANMVANSGAVGISFDFVSDSGAEANLLSIYTKNASGESIWGEKQLMCLMTCLELRTISTKPMLIERYDFNTRSKEKINADVYVDLINKPVGIVLQAEEYVKRDGSIGSRVNLVRFFDAKTRKTAQEILDKVAQPKKLDAFLSTLTDKKLPDYEKPRQSASYNSGNEPPIDSYYDDSIPF